MASPSIFECDMDVLNQDVPNFGGTKADDSCESEAMDEGTVNVEKGLMQTLSVEVKELVAMMKNKDEWKKLRGTDDTMICPFCPCRQFRSLYKQGKAGFLVTSSFTILAIRWAPPLPRTLWPAARGSTCSSELCTTSKSRPRWSQLACCVRVLL